ncbi:hypothetical protein KY290_025257 [Solanum tuberosum]|uniref:RNase III domain-containing protein n=1 Tax=Solanum tuberosum TaxID=4113 RepID=A0ABQ7UV53_SOLTU|nr:hypothetical protein KY284_025641 [Solanum tuberosum]KAH0754987.1 hypothetical protein KY290_025257 [Solanum tuberosum]
MEIQPRSSALDQSENQDLSENKVTLEWKKFVEELQEVVGYKFKNVNLLYQAFTHSSFHREDECESYERLEYIGDSVLNLLIAKAHYFLHLDLAPGQLTRLRAANVDTEKLARVAVKYDFHKYLRHKKPLLKGQVKEFKDAMLEYPLHSSGLIDPPKVLADVVESLIGAIYIDCNFSMDITWQAICNKDVDFALMAFVVWALLINPSHYLSSQHQNVTNIPTWGNTVAYYRHPCPCLRKEFKDATLEYPLHSSVLIDPPKVLADVVESLIGAIYIDCDFSMDITWQAIYRPCNKDVDSALMAFVVWTLLIYPSHYLSSQHRNDANITTWGNTVAHYRHPCPCLRSQVQLKSISNRMPTTFSGKLEVFPQLYRAICLSTEVASSSSNQHNKSLVPRERQIDSLNDNEILEDNSLMKEITYVEVAKPIQLDQATIKKTRSSCARVKVLIDLKGKFPTSVQMNIENPKIGEMRSSLITIQYDYVPKYCLECKMQGHNKINCKAGVNARRKEEPAKQFQNNINLEQQPLLEKGNAKFFSSGKVVGDPGELAKEWVAKSFGRVLHGENYKDKEQVEDNIAQQNLSKNEASLRSGQESQPNSTLTSPPVEASKMSVEHEGVYNNKEEINIPSSQEEEILGVESVNEDSNRPATQTNNQLCPYESDKKDKGIHVNEHKQTDDKDSNNDLAIVPFPTPIQADNTKMDIPQSPNEVLHNILTHIESEFEHLQLRDTIFQVENIEDKIFRDADLSPRSMGGNGTGTETGTEPATTYRNQ